MTDGPPSMVTIYVCPVCGTWDMDEHYTGGHDFDRFPDCHVNRRVPRRMVSVDVLVDEQVIRASMRNATGSWRYLRYRLRKLLAMVDEREPEANA